MWDYSEKVKEHFFNPRNAKVVSEANGIGDVGSISCGDALRLMLKVDPASERIIDAGFQTFGCGSAIASSSALTELVIGRTLDEALTITNQQIADYLDGLPPEKMHCSVMGMEALHAAVANYRGEQCDHDHDEGELICRCFGIDSALIDKVVADNGLTSLEQVIQYTKAGGACATCHDKIEARLHAVMASAASDVSAPPPVALASAAAPRTAFQRIKVIEGVIERMRPIFVRDGGDISLVDVDGDLVYVRLSGACAGCGMSFATLSALQQQLCDALGEAVDLFPVSAPRN